MLNQIPEQGVRISKNIRFTFDNEYLFDICDKYIKIFDLNQIN
jgi:hypothetical protein